MKDLSVNVYYSAHILLCKGKKHYLFTCEVGRYYSLPLHGTYSSMLQSAQQAHKCVLCKHNSIQYAAVVLRQVVSQSIARHLKY